MASQPAALRRLIEDDDDVRRASERLADRKLFLVGTGTSWHAANHGAWLLREAGACAIAVQAIDAALYGLTCTDGSHGVIVLSHRNSKRYASQVVARAREAGAPCIVVSGRGAGGDVETVEPESSAAFTASHLGALLRLAQLAELLGARLGDLAAIPDAVELALTADDRYVAPPDRLLELTGAGPNTWTAAEGALKVRETAFVASEGLSVEQLLHGPAVALDERDALVALDGGGPASQRLEEVARAAEGAGAAVHRVRETTLGEPLSVFPLTAAVHRIALEAAEARGTDPDSFGFDVAAKRGAWEPIEL
jgi:glutamine---fructose-6-phosphate transaminase (isomerizing)